MKDNSFKEMVSKPMITLMLFSGLFLLFIVCSSLVQGTVYNYTTSYALTTTQSSAFYYGIVIKPNVDSLLYNVSVRVDSGTQVIIYECPTYLNTSVYSTCNKTGYSSVSSNLSQFNGNVTLLKGHLYEIVVGNTGSSYTMYRTTTIASYPIYNESFNITGSAINNKDGTEGLIGATNIYYNIYSVITGTGTPSDYTPVLVNQSPNDVTSTNIIGNPLLLVYNISQPNINNSLVYINYSFTGDKIINGTPMSKPYNHSYKNISGSLYTFEMEDNEVYPYTSIYDSELIEDIVHYNFTVSNSNVFYKSAIYGLNGSKNNSFLEIYLSTSGNSRVYYCNSSYTTGQIALSSYCVLFGSTSSNSFNHTHNNSKHNIFSLPLVNGSLGGVVVTENSSFAVTSFTGNAYIGYINGSVRSDTLRYTNNNGNTWSSVSNGILDFHVHQYGNNDVLSWNVCGSNSTERLCSIVASDSYNITLLPPTTNTVSLSTYSSFYNETITMTRTNSNAFNSNITSYSFYVYDANFTLYETLNTSSNQTSIFITPDNYSSGYYYGVVKATDSNNQTSLSYSNVFSVTSKYINPCNETITLNSTGVPVFFNFSQNSRNETVEVIFNTGTINYTITDTYGDNVLITSLPTTSYNVYTHENIDTDTMCSVTFCVNTWTLIPSPCTNNLRYMNYTYSCPVPYDNPYSDMGTYVDCVSPSNTDKELWLLIFLLVIWLTGLVLAIAFAPLLVIIAWITSIGLLYYSNVYFGNVFIGLGAVVITTLVTFTSFIMSKK